MKRAVTGLCLVCTIGLVAGGCNGLPGVGTPTVSLSIDKTSMTDSDVATITATLNFPIMKTVEVDLAYGGTAQSGIDYTRSAMKIVIPPFAKTGTVTIRGLKSTTFQDTVDVTVDIASATNAILLAGQQSFDVSITNNNCAADRFDTSCRMARPPWSRTAAPSTSKPSCPTQRISM